MKKAILLLLVALAAIEVKASDDGSLQIEDIRCEGNTSTECSFIKGQLFLSINDQLDEEEVRNSEIRLSFF